MRVPGAKRNTRRHENAMKSAPGTWLEGELERKEKTSEPRRNHEFIGHGEWGPPRISTEGAYPRDSCGAGDETTKHAAELRREERK